MKMYGRKRARNSVRITIISVTLKINCSVLLKVSQLLHTVGARSILLITGAQFSRLHTIRLLAEQFGNDPQIRLANKPL